MLAPRQRWLDLRSFETREALRHELARRLFELGLNELDLSSVTGGNRALTQATARWAHEQGAAGLVYHSRFDSRLTCWALFEGAAFEAVGPSEPVDAADPDLLDAARAFGLGVEPDLGLEP